MGLLIVGFFLHDVSLGFPEEEVLKLGVVVLTVTILAAPTHFNFMVCEATHQCSFEELFLAPQHWLLHSTTLLL